MGSWEILFAMDFFKVALVFEPTKQSHPAPTFPGTSNNAPLIYTVVYTFQTLIFISHLTSNLVLLSGQNGNHNSDFTGLKTLIKHRATTMSHAFPRSPGG